MHFAGMRCVAQGRGAVDIVQRADDLLVAIARRAASIVVLPATARLRKYRATGICRRAIIMAGLARRLHIAPLAMVD